MTVVVQMMTAPIRDQMYKAVTGFSIMACLAVACIHVPVQLAKAISPGLFPMHLKVSSDRVPLGRLSANKAALQSRGAYRIWV
jgi:hypothetical protein